MRAAEISEDEISHRVKVGALIPEYRGVYRVGHRAPSLESRCMAAVKAGGDGAALCGAASGYLLRILKASKPPPPQVMTRTEKRITGVKTRRTRNIDRRDITQVGAIPCTTVPRTIVDLAATLDEDALARVCHEAGVLYGTTPRHIEAVLARRPNAPGAKRLRRVLHGDTKVALSVLEREFLETLKREDLPLPDTNRRVGTYRVDCRWPGHDLTVELDGYRYHNSRHSWQQGNDREREARERGDDFRRFTYADVFEDQRYMLGELRKLLR